MELIYSDKQYAEFGVTDGSYLKELCHTLKEFDVNILAREDDIGYGADWPVILIEIFNDINWSSILKVGSIPTLFFLGKRINENIEGWLEISRRIKKLLKKAPAERIDEKSALCIVLQDMESRGYKFDNISITLKVHSYDGQFNIEESLSKRPNSLYIFEIETAEIFIIYGVMSDGQISFRHQYGKFWFDFIEDRSRGRKSNER